MTQNAQYIIDRLNLKPHPEGGYFRETYRSSGTIEENHLDGTFDGDRSYSTCIYFLLTSEKFSAFHRIKQDEVWHFYDGSPIKLHVISKDGRYTEQLIGSDLEKKQVPQYVVTAGNWFAAEVLEPNSFSFVGCTVAPGFDFRDFEMKSRAELIELFPEYSEIISSLTHN